MAIIKCCNCGKDYNDDLKFHDKTIGVRCPFCGLPPYCTAQKQDNSASNGNAQEYNIFSTILCWAILFALVFAIVKIGSCGGKSSFDGKCDICGKPATYSSDGEEYCDKHLVDAVNYYLGND